MRSVFYGLADEQRRVRAKRLLRTCAGTLPGVGIILGRHYEWVRDRFLPALDTLSLFNLPEDRELLATNWDILSAICSLNEGYGAAMKAGQRAVELAPSSGAIVLEFAELCEQVGQFEAGCTALKDYLSMSPNDEDATLLLTRLSEPTRKQHHRTLDSWETQVADALATFQPTEALKLLKHRRSVTARTWRRRVYGALDEHSSEMREWENLKQIPGKLELHPADWFYLSLAAWEDPAFWSLMIELRAKLGMSWIPIHDTIMGLSCDHTSLMFRFHLARTSRDSKSMQHLYESYPTWTEARQYASLVVRA